MKNVLILILFSAFISCGKKESRDTESSNCNSQSQVIYHCYKSLQYNYGHQWASNYCNQQYPSQGCYNYKESYYSETRIGL